MSTRRSFTSSWFLLFLLFIVDVTDSLVCYSCRNCNDPFQSTYVYGQWLNDTQTLYCTKTSRGYVTSRGISSSCTPSGVIGNGNWCCQKNLCNRSNQKMFTDLFMLIIINLAILMLIKLIRNRF